MMRRDAVLAVGKYRQFDDGRFRPFPAAGRIRTDDEPPEVLLKYRIHSSNISKTAAYHETVDRIFGEIVDEARRRRGLPAMPSMPDSPRVADASPTEERVRWTWWALGAGHVRTARNMPGGCWPPRRCRSTPGS